MSEMDTQHRMLQTLGQMQQALTAEWKEFDPEVGQILWDEIQEQLDCVQRRQVLFDPQERDDLAMEAVMELEGVPAATGALIAAFLQLYRNEPLPPHGHPILDSIETDSSIPFVRIRNVDWQRTFYRGSLLGADVVWAAMVLDQELEDTDFAHRLWSARMTACYERETVQLGFKLYTRWDLADTLPAVVRDLDLADMTFLVFHKDAATQKYLTHLQFMLNTYVELNVDSEILALPEAILDYCRVLPADVFQKLRPPLSRIVLLDEELSMILHFGDPIEKVQSLITQAVLDRG